MKWSPAKRTLDPTESQYARKCLWAQHFAPAAWSHTSRHRSDVHRFTDPSSDRQAVVEGRKSTHSFFNRANIIQQATECTSKLIGNFE